MVDYNGLENRRAERHRGFESLSLRNKEASEFSDAFFCCGCEPGSHVLSVASLCESAPSGRARIPLWERMGSAQPIPLSHPKN